MLQVRRHSAVAAVAPSLPVKSAAAPPASAASAAASTPTPLAPSASASALPAKAKPKPPRAAPKQLDAGRIATVQGAPLDYHRLIVRNLAFDVTDAVLLQAFAPDAAAVPSGATLARVMTKPNGRSMGFGFVEFGSIADAAKVLAFSASFLLALCAELENSSSQYLSFVSILVWILIPHRRATR